MCSVIRKFLPILIVCLIVSNYSFAKMPKGLMRFQIGYSFPFTTATFKQHSLTYDDYGDNNLDTTYSRDVRSKGGFGVTLGTYIPIAQLTEKSSLNLDIDFMYNFLVWDAAKVNYSGYDNSTGQYTYSTNYTITSATVQMGLPIGLSFKAGGEASMDRGDKLSFTFGTGVLPTLNATIFDTYTGAKFKLQPYLKAELGFFAGVNFKVRALYAFGKLEYLNYDDSYAGDTYAYQDQASLTSKSSFLLSVMVMPLSFGWSKEAWWR